MRIWLLGAVMCLLACDAFLKLNPNYCDEGVSCAPGVMCDLFAHRCLSPGEDAPLALFEITPGAAGRGGGTLATLIGQGFRPGASVRFQGVDSPDVTFISSTELHAIVPGGSCGASKVVVRNPDGVEVQRTDLFGYRIEQVNFMATSNFNLDPDTLWITSGLINSGSAIDLLSGLASAPSLEEITNDGAGSFAAKSSVGGTDIFRDALIRDMDRDGATEIVARSDTVIEVFQSIDGRSANRINLMSRDMAVIDADLDGKLDIVALNSSGDTMVTLLQVGALNFTTMVGIGISFTGKFLHVADFNQDGAQDIAVASATNPEVLLCIASPAGTTSCTMSTIPVPTKPEFMGTVDTDSSGGTALAVLTSDFGTGKMTILDLMRGAPVMLSQFDIGKTPYKLLFVDMDCDGLRDIVVFHYSAQAVDIFFNQRNGQFTMNAKRIPVGIGSTPTSMSLQIFNTNPSMDLPDLVTLSHYNDVTPAVLRVFKNISQ